ncbi:hypothetical protein D9619_004190 [Psilocybe cf. subviscida]|uniref:HNH nuclease domain-containing protein n=1 Tax=Psilocybe cf. subviscida TaxID=2480587 RepID=A0A8H5F8E1_9AGAR|nr:hypothetical protein D9619_004190 [Psilocybe cf. subviscida]
MHVALYQNHQLLFLLSRSDPLEDDSVMSTQSTSSVDYSCGAESIDPFDSDHPENKLEDLEDPDDYKWLALGGDVVTLGPPVPSDSRRKVKAIDPCQGRCLVTNATPDSGIKYTHCLPTHLTEDLNMIRRLEWYWGMRMGELDLNTEYNIFPVSAQLSAMHEYPRRAPSWFLVPEDHIVDMFFSRTTIFDMVQEPCKGDDIPCYSRTWRGNLPDLQEKTYKYRLVPMYMRMEGMTLTHIQHPVMRRPKLSDVTVDVHPFDNLPWVTSHLDPKFVIMEAGRKLDKVGSSDLKWGNALFKEWFNGLPVLRPLLLLYEAWSAPMPSEAAQDFGFSPPVVSDPSFSLQIDPDTSSDLHSGEVIPMVSCNPDPAKDCDKWDHSAIAQWSIDASGLGIPPDSFSSKDPIATQGGGDQVMDLDEDSQLDFMIGAGSRTPPRRLIFFRGW